MKKEEKKVSVIIPVYNVEKYVEQCIKSITSQSYENLEIIAVNDGSTDSSGEIIKKLQKEDARIIVIDQKNSGVSAARNAGLQKATGEYITFVDADDYVATDYIEYLFKMITQNDAEFAYTINMFQSIDNKQIEDDEIRTVSNDESTAIILSPDVVVSSPNKIYSRRMLEAHKLQFSTDLFYGEGLHFIIRCSLIAKKIAVGKRRIYYYRKNNMMSATTKYNHLKYVNGLQSLEKIGKIINQKDDYVESMYKLHLSTFYLGAIVKMIRYKKVKEYKKDYDEWKMKLKKNVGFILRSKYISAYRKMMILAGSICPQIIAFLDKKRMKKIVEKSV